MLTWETAPNMGYTPRLATMSHVGMGNLRLL